MEEKQIEVTFDTDVGKVIDVSARDKGIKKEQWVVVQTGGDKWHTEFHIFVDVSTLAYGAVVCTRNVVENNVKVSFVMSKTKVVPLKVISVPRLDLITVPVDRKLRVAKYVL